MQGLCEGNSSEGTATPLSERPSWKIPGYGEDAFRVDVETQEGILEIFR